MRGKSVLITGAARGIGAETARQLAEKGAKVALLGLEPEALKQVAAELRAGRGRGSRPTSTDREALDAR